MKKTILFILTLALVISLIPAVPFHAWNMPFDAPPVISDPAFQFPALDNGEVVLNKTTGRLPALGWNSWNAFASSINEGRIRGIADAFITRGLDKVGYEYVVIDDGCYPSNRVDGKLTNNAAFASGFKAMSDYIHGLGLKFGMYNDVGVVTCANQQGLYGYEDVDAQSFAEWDIDYIKVDYCGYPWDIGYRSAVAPNQQYVYAPRIRSVTISGGGLAAPITLNAVADGIHINNPDVNVSGNFVARIGTDMSKYNSQLHLNRSIFTPFWRELGFNIDVPDDGMYDMVVNYSTGRPANYSDETSQSITSTTVRIGRWLQVAVGPQEDETRFFDNALPITDTGTTQTYTYANSPVIKVGLKKGENLLRLMNHRREENALQSYAAFLDGLNKAGAGDKIILSVCDWGQTRPYHWAYKVGDSWRTSDDITLSTGVSGSASWGSGATPSTSSIMGQYNKNVILDEYAGLGRGWNDPDMMVIGMSGINATMAKSHMALWCMMNSPIMLGFDLTDDTKWEANKNVVLNKDIIDLNQDPLGIQSKRIYTSLALSTGDPSTEYITNANRIDVIAKPLANGDVALTFINCGSGTNGTKSASVSADTIIKYIGAKMADGNGNIFKNASSYIVKDLWSKATSINTTGTFSVTNLGITDDFTVRITPVSKEALGSMIKLSETELQARVTGAYPISPANADMAADIETARAVYNNTSAADEQIRDAIIALNGALARFSDAYEEQAGLRGTINMAMQTLTDNSKYLNIISVRAAAEVFKTAILAADAAIGNPALDKAALKLASETLAAATDAFKASVEATFVSLKAPWYNKYPIAEKVTINSPESMTIQTDSGDFWQISPSTFSAKKPNNLHLIDIPNTAENIEVTAELSFSPTANYLTAGILFYLNDHNMCSIVRRYHSGAAPNNCFMSQQNTGVVTGTATSGEQRFTDYAVSTPRCFLRIVKSGATITGYYRENESIAWRQAYAYTTNTNIANAATISVGLFAAYGSGVTAQVIPAKFENFKINGVLQPFTDNYITIIPNITVDTPLGTPPVLPAKAAAYWSDGTAEECDVVWDAISPDKYSAYGTFDVDGYVHGANRIIVAHVNVIPSSIRIVPGNDEAEAVFTIASKDAFDYSYIFALYNMEGYLVDVDKKTGALAAGKINIETLKIAQPRGYTVKAFLWDAHSYIPIIRNAEYTEPWIVNKAGLFSAIEAADAIDIDAYTRLSSDELLTVLAEARVMCTDDEASRFLVNGMIDKIIAAKELLVLSERNMIKLTGTYYGRAGSYNNSASVTWDKMFDGSTSTFFDSNTMTDAWAGIDLGEGNETFVYQFRYYPRSSFVTRMNACTIRGSMTQSNGEVGTVLHTVEGLVSSGLQWYTVPSDVMNQKFRYIWIQSGPDWNGNTAELEFYGRGPEADLSLLSDRITYADSLTAAKYTAVSWANLQAALAPARALTKDSAQPSIDIAVKDIKTALAQLEA